MKNKMEKAFDRIFSPLEELAHCQTIYGLLLTLAVVAIFLEEQGLRYYVDDFRMKKIG